MKSAVDIAMDMGFDRVNATGIVSALWFSPGGTDPLSPQILMMIQKIQLQLIGMGVKTPANGVINPQTIDALDQISGPTWKNKAWIQIFGDVLRAKASGYKYREPRRVGMGYYSAMGGLAVTQWCSEKNPQGSCKPLAGVCKPMFRDVLNAFAALQNEINRTLGTSEIAVDKQIGTKTVAAANKALAGFPHGFGTFGHCDSLAAVADEVTSFLKSNNDRAAKPAVAGKRSFTPQPRVRADGTVENPSNLAIQAGGFANALSSPIGLVGVGVGVLMFLKMRKSKKKAPARGRRR